ncbi:glyoxalase [Kribbella sandramycini]|uniref:Catechol 2,3-dioxygenase-like lactoylglutathione lyase family enzyme n=1 Tax=Kribbella sandramycini TaxID=60450 RepID=A0A7Y4NWI1_9ACTN|nr:VOC family protein [Kribbella sandramycini]MBB6568593.1 catechol 2,3-dioxygenase-like lactoylglutathione lyase family enzyme [Kribbella sandramycini]NOL38822.1 glyoxalase [Kribbella sandramycini]
MNHFTSIHTVGIPVADQDRALAFYTNTLGLTLLSDTPLPQLAGRWIVLTTGAGASLALTPAADGEPVGRDTGVRLGTTDAAAAHAALGDAAGDLLAWPGVPPMFSFTDPDGNTLYVVQD